MEPDIPPPVIVTREVELHFRRLADEYGFFGIAGIEHCCAVVCGEEANGALSETVPPPGDEAEDEDQAKND